MLKHHTRPEGHPVLHRPPTQRPPAGQRLLHAPQLAPSLMSVSQPLRFVPSQSAKPLAHVPITQAPAAHDATALRKEHRRPHMPQLFGSELVSPHPSAPGASGGASTPSSAGASTRGTWSAAASRPGASLAVSIPTSGAASAPASSATHRPPLHTVPGPQAPPHGTRGGAAGSDPQARVAMTRASRAAVRMAPILRASLPP